MRKSFHDLVALTESVLKQDPLSGNLFVFLNRRRDRIKILYWGQTGFVSGISSSNVARVNCPATNLRMNLTRLKSRDRSYL